MNWHTPKKPFELTYSQLAKAILTGQLPPNTSLPAERELSAQMGVTRPTLREALRKLDADGWIDIHQGKKTRVRDIWIEGSLNTLSALVNYVDALPENFILHLLEVRAVLAPAYAAEAVEHHASALHKFIINDMPRDVTETPGKYAEFDYQLHHMMTVLSENPIYTLILNGFADVYSLMAEQYFTVVDTKKTSLTFYKNLADAAASLKPDLAARITGDVMKKSIKFWQILSMEDRER